MNPITIRGTLIEVGSDNGTDYDIAIKVEDERTVRVSGLAYADAREAAKHMYEQVTVEVTPVR